MTCALGGPCVDPRCGCRWPAIVRCAVMVGAEQCRLVAGHARKCEAPLRRAEKVDRADLRESKPVEIFAGEHTPAVSLAYRKRKREGMVRQQRG